MHILRIGDPHAKPNSLDELFRLVHFIEQEAANNSVDRIELLGDLFHTHNVVRLEVIEFWNQALEYLSKICEVVVLVGNHDLSGDYSSTFSALSLFGNIPNVKIIDRPTKHGIFAYMPYIHEHQKFILHVNSLSDSGAKVLVCHQTIEGSRYENGMYAPDGISTDGWAEKFVHIISGHIHAEQSFGNIIYPGTPKWDTLADANKRKGIWLYDHDEDGKILSSQFISTESVCRPIKCLEWREGNPKPEWDSQDRVTVELIGSSNWIASAKEELKGTCSIKARITDIKRTQNRNPGRNFEYFVKELFSSSLDKEILLRYAKEIGVV